MFFLSADISSTTLYSTVSGPRPELVDLRCFVLSFILDLNYIVCLFFAFKGSVLR